MVFVREGEGEGTHGRHGSENTVSGTAVYT